MVRTVAITAVLLVAAACGGYEAANRAIVADLPRLDGVDLIDEAYDGYCSGDSCAFGNDRSNAVLTYRVDTDAYSQDSLVEAYRSALTGWEATVEETCANADPSFCDEIVLAFFDRGDARISLNLDNWSGGRFELGVDAKGAP